MTSYIPTIIVAAIIAVIFIAIVVNEIKKRKSGKGSCSCGCENCGMGCHDKEK